MLLAGRPASASARLRSSFSRPPGSSSRSSARADVVERVDQRSPSSPSRLGERDRPPAPAAAPPAVGRASIASCARFEYAIASSRPGRRAARAARRASAAKRSASALWPRNQCRRESQRSASPSARRVAELAPWHRAPRCAGRDRLLDLVGQVALVAERCSSSTARSARRQVARPAQRAGVLRGRLAVRARAGRHARPPRARGASTAGAVARGLGVVGEPRRVGTARLERARAPRGAAPRAGAAGSRPRPPSRASSCRNAIARPSSRTMPESTHSSSALVGGIDQLRLGGARHDRQPRSSSSRARRRSAAPRGRARRRGRSPGSPRPGAERTSVT